MKTLGGVTALVIVSGLTLGSLAAHAQAPAAPTTAPAPAKMFTNKQQFRLPFNLADGERLKLREIQLYVKYGNEGWTCKETATPMQKAFVYKAAQDGEYWFSIVTVDKSGRPTPVDVTREPPALIVVVDTQPPEIQVTPATGSTPGEELVRCSIHDPNVDPNTVKAEYQAADKNWYGLQPVSGSTEMYRCPDRANWTGALRVSAADRAENVTTREINWMTSTAQATPAAPTIPPAPPAQATPAPVASAPVPPPVPPVNTSEMPAFPGRTTTTVQATSEKPPTVPGPELTQPAQPAPASHSNTAAPGNRQLVNNTHVVLDYRIDQVGPSGVSKVDVWMTPDQGKTWARLCEDPDRRSPVEFDLPREGLYGITVVVTNGNNISDPPPVSGTAPDLWIEVDMTRPTAQLQSVQPGSGEHVASLVITWSASDKNLGTDCIDLYYAAKREGPWVPIARGLRNDGIFRWPAPKDGGPEYFVRLEVTDLAGNVTRCETPQAVVLDLQRPKAKLLGVSASAPRLTPPVGN
jgi:hypothetical protein